MSIRANGLAKAVVGRPTIRARTTCLLLLLVAWIGGTPVQAAAQSGVLLGLDTDDGYRTVWIADGGDSTALLANGPHLLVPRADGFWRADVIEADRDWQIVVVGPASRWTAVLDSANNVRRPPPDARQCYAMQSARIRFLSGDYVSVREWGSEEGCGLGGPTRRDRSLVQSLDSVRRPVPPYSLLERLVSGVTAVMSTACGEPIPCGRLFGHSEGEGRVG